MEKIKVLHCLHSQSWGGLEIYSTELIRRLSEDPSAEHAILCAPDTRIASELKKASVRIFHFEQEKISKIKQTFLIRKILKEHQFTHLHSHSRLDMWACSLALLGNSKVRHIYNLYMNAPHKQDSFHRWLFSRVHALCGSSKVLLEEVALNFPIATDRLHLIRYGRSALSSSKQRREELREKYGVKRDQIVIGSLCRIDPGKGVRELIEALTHIPEHERNRLQLWLVGDPTIIGTRSNGSYIYEKSSDQLEKWIQETILPSSLGTHIRRIPFQKDYADYINALDVFALASYNETYSLSILDAMLMGKAIIATNSGGSIEQVGANERGLLAEPHNADSLAVCYLHYLKHPDDIYRQGRKAQEWALTLHSWPKTLKEFLNLYKSL